MEATHASKKNQHKESETLHFVLHLADLGLLRATNKGQNIQPALTHCPLWLTTLEIYSADFTLQIKCPIFIRNFPAFPFTGDLKEVMFVADSTASNNSSFIEALSTGQRNDFSNILAGAVFGAEMRFMLN